MSEHPLKVFEKIDPEVLTLVRNTNTFALADLVTISKICSSSTPMETARTLARFHKPKKADFRARFGLSVQKDWNNGKKPGGVVKLFKK